MTRNKTIDALKGYAIILVVLGHGIECIVNNRYNNKIFEFIYSFHMPLFMFLSGYIIFGKARKPYSQWLRIKAERLLIPFFIWTLISLFYYQFNFLKLSFANGLSVMKILSDAFANPSTNPWFLMALFIFYFIILIIKYLSKYLGYFAYIWIFLFLLLQPIHNLWLIYLQWYYVFFFAGYLTSEYHDKLPVLSTKIKLLFCSLFIICFFLLPYEPYRYDMLLISPIKWLFNVLIAFLGIVASYSLISFFQNKWISSLFSFLGLYTLEIYVMHELLLREGVRICSVFSFCKYFGFYMELTFITLFALLLSLGISWIIRRSVILKYILLGSKTA